MPIKTRLGLSDHTIVYAGRLGIEKNLDAVLRAVAISKQSYPSIRLVIAGHGADEGRLRNLAECLDLTSNVRFLGTLDKPVLSELFQGSDIFVTMSASETQCLALIQAMASGLPVIGANARALPEFINQSFGFLNGTTEIISLFLSK